MSQGSQGHLAELGQYVILVLLIAISSILNQNHTRPKLGKHLCQKSPEEVIDIDETQVTFLPCPKFIVNL